jgi:hypothetical protein
MKQIGPAIRVHRLFSRAIHELVINPRIVDLERDEEPDSNPSSAFGVPACMPNNEKGRRDAGLLRSM